MIISRKEKLFHCFCLAVSTVILYEFFTYEYQLPRTIHNFTRDQQSRDDDNFLSDWCRLQRSRVDWKGFVGSCRYKKAWKQRDVNSINRTDADRSFISRWEMRPQGK